MTNLAPDSVFILHEPSAEFPFWVISRYHTIEICPAEQQRVMRVGADVEWVMAGPSIFVPNSQAEKLADLLANASTLRKEKLGEPSG